MVSPPEGALDLPNYRFVKEALSQKDLEWLASLPSSTVTGDFYLCHGTSRSDEEPLLEEIRAGCVVLRHGATVAQDLGTGSERVIVCGHTHVPRFMQLPDGRLVVNPGSVGLPAYAHDYPALHAMEAGSPHARYAVLEQRDGGWKVEQWAVPYDWEVAARRSERNDRPDWAEWLRTGRAPLG